MKYQFVIPGRPITMKNSKIIITPKPKRNKFPEPILMYKKPRSFLISSKAYRKYEKTSIEELQKQLRLDFSIIESKVSVKARYWLPNRIGWPDLLGVEESTGDILQRAKIITNDKNIVSWDGSRIVGVDKENPRVEITLEEVEFEYQEYCSTGGKCHSDT